MANIREAFEYAAQNPNSDFARNLESMASSGALDVEAKKNGIDLTPFKPAPEPVKKPIAEKILDFTGGKEIAQGLGQAFAQKKSKKVLDESLNSAINQQSELLKKRKEIKDLGGDVTAIDKALAINVRNLNEIGAGAEKLLNPNELTNKQVLGDALQLATTAGGAKVAGAIAGKATQATGIGAGLLQGAKVGAGTGAVLGGVTGISQGLQEDMTGKEIVKEALGGAIGGAVTGGVLGGITGAVSGGIKSAKIAKENKYLSAITPDTKDLTPTEYEDLLNKGKITPKTSTQPSKYILSDTEKTVAKKYKDLFTDDPVKNTQNLIDEISKKDEEVGTFLKKNNGIFNTGELKNSLSKKLEGIDDLTVDEKRLVKLKKATIDNFIKGLKKNDMESLWKARKEFDRQIEKSFSGSPTLANTIKKEFRNGIQDFIADRTPDNTYKTAMREMSELFNIKDITNTKAVKEKGMNAIQLWIKRHPTRTKLIGWTAGTGLVGTIGASILKD